MAATDADGARATAAHDPAEDRAPDLLHEWQRHTSELVGALAAAGTAVLPRQLAEPLQRQLELTRRIIERERRLQQQLVEQLVAPLDGVFDLLHDSATMLHSQAEALQAAARALDETAGHMKLQADRFEATVDALRAPLELARSAGGVARRPRGHASC